MSTQQLTNEIRNLIRKIDNLTKEMKNATTAQQEAIAASKKSTTIKSSTKSAATVQDKPKSEEDLKKEIMERLGMGRSDFRSKGVKSATDAVGQAGSSGEVLNTLDAAKAKIETIRQDLEKQADLGLDSAMKEKEKLYIRQEYLEVEKEILLVALNNKNISKEFAKDGLVNLNRINAELKEVEAGFESLNKEIEKGESLWRKLTGLGDKPINGALGDSLMKLGKDIMGHVIFGSVRMAFELDSVNKAMMRATNLSSAYSDVVFDSWENNKKFSISAKQAGESMTSLNTKIAQFDRLSVQTAQQMTDFASKMVRMGATSDEAATQADFLLNVLKETPAEVEATQREIIKLSGATGGLSKTMKDYAEASEMIAAYNTKEVFFDIAKAAEATGVAVASLVAVTEKLDTFEGAAEAVGKLNVVLRGNVNITELVNASAEDKIRILIESMEASNRSWESLDRHERKLMANAAGFSSVADAAKVMQMSMPEYEDQIRKTEQLAEQQKKLEERLLEVQAAEEKWTAVKSKFLLIAKPFLEVIIKTLDFVLDITEGMESWHLAIIGLTAGVGLFTAGFVIATKTLNIFGVTATKTALGAGKAITGLTTSLSGGVVGLLKAAGSGIAGFFKSIAGAMVAMVKVAVGIGAIGIGLASVGLGLASVGWGLGLIRDGMSGITMETVGVAASMMAVVVAGGFAGVIAGPGLGLLAGGLLVVAGAVFAFPVEETRAVSSMFGNLADVFDNFSADKAAGIVGALDLLEDAVEGLDVDKVVRISAVAAATGNLFGTFEKVTPILRDFAGAADLLASVEVSGDDFSKLGSDLILLDLAIEKLSITRLVFLGASIGNIANQLGELSGKGEVLKGIAESISALSTLPQTIEVIQGISFSGGGSLSSLASLLQEMAGEKIVLGLGVIRDSLLDIFNISSEIAKNLSFGDSFADSMKSAAFNLLNVKSVLESMGDSGVEVGVSRVERITGAISTVGNQEVSNTFKEVRLLTESINSVEDSSIQKFERITEKIIEMSSPENDFSGLSKAIEELSNLISGGGEGGQTIQIVLDGKVVGETAVNYINKKQKSRSFGKASGRR